MCFDLTFNGVLEMRLSERGVHQSVKMNLILGMDTGDRWAWTQEPIVRGNLRSETLRFLGLDFLHHQAVAIVTNTARGLSGRNCLPQIDVLCKVPTPLGLNICIVTLN